MLIDFINMPEFVLALSLADNRFEIVREMDHDSVVDDRAAIIKLKEMEDYLLRTGRNASDQAQEDSWKDIELTEDPATRFSLEMIDPTGKINRHRVMRTQVFKDEEASQKYPDADLITILLLMGIFDVKQLG